MMTATYRFPTTPRGRLLPALDSARRLAELSGVPHHIYQRYLRDFGWRFTATIEQPTYEQAAEFFTVDADGLTTCSHWDCEGVALDTSDSEHEGVPAAS